MKIDDLIKELEKDKEVYDLALLYLAMKGEKKAYLLELYKKGNDSNACEAIKKAIFEDKEAMNNIKQIINFQKIIQGDIPTYDKTSKIIEKHMPKIDHKDLEEFINKNKKR